MKSRKEEKKEENEKIEETIQPKHTRIAHNIIHLHSFLSIADQILLFDTIQTASLTFSPTPARSPLSTFTKILSMTTNSKKWANKIPPLLLSLCSRASLVASSLSPSVPASISPTYITSFQYPVDGGCLTPHIDYDSSWVVLFSLGETCRFLIDPPRKGRGRGRGRGRGNQEEEVKKQEEKEGAEWEGEDGKREILFQSGDVLIFDGARKEKIRHGIREILVDTMPEELRKERGEKLGGWRMSVQLRAYGGKEEEGREDSSGTKRKRTPAPNNRQKKKEKKI